jgi:hypothetical protein
MAGHKMKMRADRTILSGTGTPLGATKSFCRSYGTFCRGLIFPRPPPSASGRGAGLGRRRNPGGIVATGTRVLADAVVMIGGHFPTIGEFWQSQKPSGQTFFFIPPAPPTSPPLSFRAIRQGMIGDATGSDRALRARKRGAKGLGTVPQRGFAPKTGGKGAGARSFPPKFRSVGRPSSKSGAVSDRSAVLPKNEEISKIISPKASESGLTRGLV